MEVFIGILAVLTVFGFASVRWGRDSRAGFNGNFHDGRGHLPPYRKL
jgi:hypothetical protein